MKTIYHLDVLGRLWMPQCHAGTSRKVEAGKGVFQKDLDDISVLDYPYTSDFGDFSSIEDFEVTKETVIVRNLKGGLRTDRRFKVLRAWKDEESSLAFMDCMFPGEGD